MTIDPRILIVVVAAFGGIIILLLLRGGPAGAGGSAFSLGGIWDSFKGKRTEILGTALLAVDQANNLDWIDDLLTAKIEKVLYALIAFTLHAAIRRTEQGQTRIEVRQKVAAVKTEEVKQVIEQAVVTPKRVEPLAPPPQPAPVPRDFS